MSYPTPFHLPSENKPKESAKHARQGKALANTFSRQNVNRHNHPFFAAILSNESHKNPKSKNKSFLAVIFSKSSNPKHKMKAFKPHFMGGGSSKLP